MGQEKKRALLLIAFGVTLFAALTNFSAVILALERCAKLVLPLFVGLILAFVLNVPMTFFEKQLERLKRKYPKLAGLSVPSTALLATFLCIVLVLYLVYTMFVPGLLTSIRSVYDIFMENVPRWLSILREHGMDTAWISNQLASWDLNKIVASITGYVGNLGNALGRIVEATTSIVSVTFNALMGFVIAIYVLLSKKSLERQCKKMLYAHLKKKHADRICHISKLVSDTYSRFFSGQCIEALILGVLMFAAFSLCGLPYANLIAVLTAVMSFVPYIGAFISCAVGAVLILMVSPLQALLSIVVYQVVQFIENQFIYPRVVGGSVGLAPLWTLTAALIGGNLFGILGMIFAIPVTAVVYALIKDDANRRLRDKNIKIS